jgi:hypothetical protein
MENFNDEHAELAALGWEFRLAEQERGIGVWFAVPPECLPAADDLHRHGWLVRRSTEAGARWRLTDQGLAALRVDAATSDPCLN